MILNKSSKDGKKERYCFRVTLTQGLSAPGMGTISTFILSVLLDISISPCLPALTGTAGKQLHAGRHRVHGFDQFIEYIRLMAVLCHRRVDHTIHFENRVCLTPHAN